MYKMENTVEFLVLVQHRPTTKFEAKYWSKQKLETGLVYVTWLYMHPLNICWTKQCRCS